MRMSSEPVLDHTLLEAFVEYLRRQTDSKDEDVVLLSRSRSAPRDWSMLPTKAEIVVAEGEIGAWRRSGLRRRGGLHLQYGGRARAGESSGEGLPVAIWDRWDRSEVGSPPPSFNVTAIVTTYNEEDIIEQQIERLLRDGLQVHLIDNWSTDDTLARVKAKADEGPVTVERWPEDGPSKYFDLQGLLGKVEQVAHTCGADWVIHHDTDEIHESAWKDTSLRDGLWALDRWGFNAVDHTGLDFRPIDNRWKPGDDLATSFEWFEFPPFASYYTLVKAWKPQPQLVDLASNGGHDVVFPGRRVFPYKFVIRHYPIRSQEHGERKILRERKSRWDPEERAKGWHVHYDHFTDGSEFLWDPGALHRWRDIDELFLIQRLSGAGLPGNPRPDECIAAGEAG